MAQRKTFSEGIEGDLSVNAGQLERFGNSTRPNPEQGHRLMRAFVSIRQAALREAIVKFVDELSTLQDDNREP